MIRPPRRSLFFSLVVIVCLVLAVVVQCRWIAGADRDEAPITEPSNASATP